MNQWPLQGANNPVGARCAFAAQLVTGTRIDRCLVAEIEPQIALNVDPRFGDVFSRNGFGPGARSVERCLMARPIRLRIEPQRCFVENSAGTGCAIVTIGRGPDTLLKRRPQDKGTGADADRRKRIGFLCGTAPLLRQLPQIFALCPARIFACLGIDRTDTHIVGLKRLAILRQGNSRSGLRSGSRVCRYGVFGRGVTVVGRLASAVIVSRCGKSAVCERLWRRG
jgi:hypothetical protein